MKHLKRFIFIASFSMIATQCSPKTTQIENVNEIPLKSTIAPEYNTGLHRAQALYLLHGATSVKDRTERLGQYYVIDWTNADPKTPKTLEMFYTQKATKSKIQKRTISIPPSSSTGNQKTTVAFTGDDYKTLGPVLSWKVNLIEHGKVISTKESYLWDDRLPK